MLENIWESFFCRCYYYYHQNYDNDDYYTIWYCSTALQGQKSKTLFLPPSYFASQDSDETYLMFQRKSVFQKYCNVIDVFVLCTFRIIRFMTVFFWSYVLVLLLYDLRTLKILLTLLLLLYTIIVLTGDVPGSPQPKPQPKSQTKGKWLKITRKGLLVSAISRMGKTWSWSSLHSSEQISNIFHDFHHQIKLFKKGECNFFSLCHPIFANPKIIIFTTQKSLNRRQNYSNQADTLNQLFNSFIFDFINEIEEH